MKIEYAKSVHSTYLTSISMFGFRCEAGGWVRERGVRPTAAVVAKRSSASADCSGRAAADGNWCMPRRGESMDRRRTLASPPEGIAASAAAAAVGRRTTAPFEIVGRYTVAWCAIDQLTATQPTHMHTY